MSFLGVNDIGEFALWRNGGKNFNEYYVKEKVLGMAIKTHKPSY